MTYSEKLRDPRWQRKRLEIMKRDNFTCLDCKSTIKTLNVHHHRYRRDAQPWDYSPLELGTYCHECHEAREQELKNLATAVFCMASKLTAGQIGRLHKSFMFKSPVSVAIKEAVSA